MIAVVFFSTIFLQQSLSSPLPSNDKAEPPSNATDNNCTNSHQLLTNFNNLLTGLKVLQKSSQYYAYKNINKLISALYPIGSCAATVNYRNAKTQGLVQTVSLNNVASWYTVFTSYVHYLDSLQPSNQEDLMELQSITSFVDAVNQELFYVMQDLQCNCSTDCYVAEPEFEAAADSCKSPLKHVEHLFTYDIIPHALVTVRDFVESCSCDNSDSNSTADPLEWFNAHLPDNNNQEDSEKIRSLLRP